MPVSYVKVKGVKQVRDSLGKFKKMLESEPYKIMVEEAIRAQEEVRMEVPVLTGRLQAGSAIYIDPSSSKLNPRIVGEAEAIDPDTGYDYSSYQHDNPYLNHPRGGKPFFIRDPFNRMVDRIDRRFESELGYDRASD